MIGFMRAQDKETRLTIACKSLPMTYKFSVGQMVDRDRDHMSRKEMDGPYEVLRHLPLEDAHDEPSYRIRSLKDRHERVVKESTLHAGPTGASA
jgi:hypothetical protein